jgi:hypothetical protein
VASRFIQIGLKFSLRGGFGYGRNIRKSGYFINKKRDSLFWEKRLESKGRRSERVTGRLGEQAKRFISPIALSLTHPFLPSAGIEAHLLATKCTQFFGKHLRRVAVGAGAVGNEDGIFKGMFFQECS